MKFNVSFCGLYCICNAICINQIVKSLEYAVIIYLISLIGNFVFYLKIYFSFHFSTMACVSFNIIV